MLLFLCAQPSQAFQDNRISSVETRKKFKIGKTVFGIGAVVQPEFSIRRQRVQTDGNVEGINPFFGLADTKALLDAAYTTANNWTIGYLIRINCNPADFAPDRNFVMIKHDTYGTIHLGCQQGVHDLETVKLAQALSPTVWIDGDIDSHIDVPHTTYGGSDFIGTSGNAFKINYLSKVFGNAEKTGSIQFGVSYTPETKIKGSGKRSYFAINTTDEQTGNSSIWQEGKSPFGRHHFVLTALYNILKSDFDIKVAGALMWEAQAFQADTKKDGTKLASNAVQRAFGFMAATSVEYKKWHLGIEYWNSLHSRLPTATTAAEALTPGAAYHNGHAGQSINAMLSYSITPAHTVGLGGQHTWRTYGAADDQLTTTHKTLLTAAYSWKFAECATWYVELDLLNFAQKNADGTWEKFENAKPNLKTNRGFVAMTGVRVEI